MAIKMQIMKRKDFERITFTSHNNNFEMFYKSMKDTLIELSTQQNLFTCNRVISTFIGTYRYAVVNEDYGEEIDRLSVEINDELINDDNLKRMIKYNEQDIDVRIEYNQRYYIYFHKMIKLFSLFIESLNQTLMPNTYSGGKKLRYSYNIPFFFCYSDIKKVISENMNTFTIEKFIKPINSIIVFYYGYKSFVTDKAREDIEKVISMMIVVLSDKDFLKLVRKEQRGTKDQEDLNKLKNEIYLIILKIYAKINAEHSVFDLNPQIVQKVYIDSTGI